MNRKVMIISLLLAVCFSQHALAADTFLKGSIAGGCTMQLDGNFQVSHNGEIDSNGHRLANLPNLSKEIIGGGATWPVKYCPNKGSNLEARCETGWKPINQSIVQMNTGSGFAYWISIACAKL